MSEKETKSAEVKSEISPQIKLESVLRQYDGNTDFDDWYSKFKIVAKFSSWESDDAKLAMLVLRLEGSALLVYNQMPETAQESFDSVVNKLRSAFMPSHSDAHKSLMSRKYNKGESPDKLVADLIRYWKLSTMQEGVSHQVVFQSIRPFFFSALPHPVSQQLKLSGIKDMETLIERCKELLSDYESLEDSPPAIGAVGGKGGKRWKGGQFNRKRKCFKCGSFSHLMSECKFEKSVCFICKNPDHVSADCPKKGHNGHLNNRGGEPKSSAASH